MIATFAAWVIFFAAAYGYTRLFSRPGVETPERTACDAYLGLLLISGLLLALSLEVRLAWWVGVLVLAPGLFLFARDRSRRLRAQRHWPVLVLASLAAFVSLGEVTYYDTGLYHQPAVKWLSEFGLVPGIALLHYRLGVISSWFALAAPVNDGFFAGREAAMIGGLLFVLIILTVLGILDRALTQRHVDVGSLSWLWYGAALLAVSAAWNMQTSLSPDLAAWLLPVAVATTLSSPAEGAGRGLRSVFTAALCGLAKMSALPIFCYAAVVALPNKTRELRWPKLLAGSLACLAVVGLGIYASYKASGCPAFPSSIFCVEEDWSVGHQGVAQIQMEIQEFLRSGGLLRREMLPLLLLTAGFSIVSWIKGKKDAFVRHSLGVSWAGILPILVLAPNTRYAIGYLLLPVATGMALLSHSLAVRALSTLQDGELLPSKLWLAATAVFCILAAGSAFANRAELTSLLYPKRLPHAQGDPIRVVNRRLDHYTTLFLARDTALSLQVLRPVSSDQCWDASIPCTPELNLIRLRDESQGFGGGFVRITTSTVPQLRATAP